MKRLLSVLLVLLLILTCAACGKKPKEEVSSKPDSSTSEGLASSSSSDSSESSDDVSSSVSSFEEILEDNNLEVTETENEDGSITVELNPTAPEKDDTDDNSSPSKPAIPTIDTLPKPQPLPDEEDESSDVSSTEEPTEPDTPSNTESDDSSDTSTSSENTPSAEPDEPEENKDYTYTTGQTHTAVPITKRYIYSTLSPTQKEWYKKIDAAVRNFETTVDLNAELVENKDYYIYYMYMFDNPEHFYLCNTINIFSTGNSQGGIVITYSDGTETSNGKYYSAVPANLLNKIKAKKQLFDQRVNEIISTIPDSAPDVVKEKLIYDRLIIDAQYNLNAHWNGFCEDNWSAYGVLMNKRGVCESYSEAFQLLCLKVGINCTGIVGTAGGGHKWNAVKLEGEWYACDVTFDDPIGAVDGVADFHFYFNLTTAQMESAFHYAENDMYPVPICTGTKYSFKYFSK